MKAIVALLLLTTAAHAAGSKTTCEPLKVPDGMTATPMTAAQFHFLQGIWVLHPNTPAGLPPGDGATIITKKGDKDGVILITQKKGTLACAILPAPAELMSFLRQEKDGPGEAL